MPEFEKVELSAVPLDPSGYALVDLFVRLPAQERFIRFIVAGDIITDEKKAALQRHIDPGLYIQKALDLAPAVSVSAAMPPAPAPAPAPELPGLESISSSQNSALSEIAKNLLAGTDPVKQMEVISGEADNILAVVAPEVKDIKGHLMKTTKFLEVMNDSAAMTTLSIFFALANGFDSKKSFRDLALATLVMDAGLAEFTSEELKQYYVDRTQLPQDTLARFLKHPTRSHELGRDKLGSLSEGTMVLILSHHELFNGKGYPRAVRSESLFPLVKVLAFAVDVYERLKRAQYLGEELTLQEAVAYFKEVNVESHLKRHSKALVEKVLKYFESGGAA